MSVVCSWPWEVSNISVCCLGSGGRCVEVSRCSNTTKETVPAKPAQQPWQRRLRDDEEEEDLSESGRLFVRNLPFTSTEEDLEKVFSKYGECLPWDWGLQGKVFPLSRGLPAGWEWTKLCVPHLLDAAQLPSSLWCDNVRLFGKRLPAG